MKTGIGQSKYRKFTLFQVVWSVPAKVFSTVTFSIWSILTDHDLFWSDVEQDWSYTVFALFFFTLFCIRKMLRGKFQKASNLIHLYDPRRAPYPTKVWNHSTTSSQIHPPSTGYIRGTIHYQSYRILKENQVNKAGVISFEWSFHCIHMNGITRKTSYTKVVNKTAKFE